MGTAAYEGAFARLLVLAALGVLHPACASQDEGARLQVQASGDLQQRIVALRVLVHAAPRTGPDIAWTSVRDTETVVEHWPVQVLLVSGDPTQQFAVQLWGLAEDGRAIASAEQTGAFEAGGVRNYDITLASCGTCRTATLPAARPFRPGESSFGAQDGGSMQPDLDAAMTDSASELEAGPVEGPEGGTAEEGGRPQEDGTAGEGGGATLAEAGAVGPDAMPALEGGVVDPPRGVAPAASGESHNTCGLPDVLECVSAGCVQRLQDEANCGACGELCAGLCRDGVCLTPELPAGCTPLEHAGRSYLLCREALTWKAARGACQDKGKDLARVESEGEADFLAGQLTDVPFVWLGVLSDNGEVYRQIVPNAPVDEGSPLPSYLPWVEGEPTRYRDCVGDVITVCQWGDDGVVLRDDGLFASAYAENLLPYLCEGPAD